MYVWGLDWGHGTKTFAVRDERDGSKKVVHCKAGLAAFIESLSPGDKVVLEPMFESYHRAEHNRVIKLAKKQGVELLTVPGRVTAARRREWGLEKTDETDARIILDISKEGVVHLAAPRIWKEDKATRGKKIEQLRRVGYPKKDKFVREALSYLPEYKTIPADIQRALGNGKEYSRPYTIPLVAVSLDVRDAGGNREEFDRRVGAFGHGYPSLLRAQFYNSMNGRLKTLMCQAAGVRSLKKIDGNIKVLRKAQMKTLRKATRFVFAKVRSAGTPEPEMGMKQPNSAL